MRRGAVRRRSELRHRLGPEIARRAAAGRPAGGQRQPGQRRARGHHEGDTHATRIDRSLLPSRLKPRPGSRRCGRADPTRTAGRSSPGWRKLGLGKLAPDYAVGCSYRKPRPNEAPSPMPKGEVRSVPRLQICAESVRRARPGRSCLSFPAVPARGAETTSQEYVIGLPHTTPTRAESVSHFHYDTDPNTHTIAAARALLSPSG